jgi:SAM-dependent methyltransferase
MSTNGPVSNPPGDDPEIVPKARRSIHDVVLAWFADQPRGKVLDVPAGYGHLSQKLVGMGFDVVGGEIEPAIFKARSVPCIFADLNNRIEAPDASFDYVCCIDGVEHMLNPYRAVEELSRVLRPGGIGVFSIPNYSNIERRLKFFLAGYLTKPKTLDDFRASGGNFYNFHNSPLTITLLDLVFTVNGLEVREIRRDKIKKGQWLLAPLVYLLKLAALCSSPQSRRKNGAALTLRNDVVLGGNTLIFITQKNTTTP